MTPEEIVELQTKIQTIADELAFDGIGFARIDMSEHQAHLNRWLAKGYHGGMSYMARHGTKRSHPNQLVDNTIGVISVRLNYWPEAERTPSVALDDPEKAYISRYALGRDYHKLLRKRLKQLAERISDLIGPYQYRVFTDSAPVLEKALAANAGLGWIGKHSNLIHPKTGSYFFLGEIFTDLPFVANDKAISNHCGQCSACLDACPTGAIVAPYQVDARRCISYLTIEHFGPIPEPLRAMMGNRIYGCDDCQIVCPWNRFTKQTDTGEFYPREGLEQANLIDLFSWPEDTFLNQTEGSAIRRIGHERWLRNIAIALGNGSGSPEVIAALRQRQAHASSMVRDAVDWALGRLLM